MQEKKKKKRKSFPATHKKKPSRSPVALATLEPFFAHLLKSYHTSYWLSSDPIQYAHRYTESDDREIAAFLAAVFAYGSVQLIHRAVSSVLAPMGESPAKFVRNYNGGNYWPGFYHRFHHEGHVMVLIRLLQRALSEYRSLSQLFRMNAESAGTGDNSRCEAVLNGAARWFQAQACVEIQSLSKPELSRGMRFFFNAPSDGSACKRMVMFLRWMVRKDDIDLGLWDWFDPRELVVPADTHVSRIAYYLRLRGGKEGQAANWKMAREITDSLRVLNPRDPVCYDFALARLGILDICKKKYAKSICEQCPVEPGCRFSNIRHAAGTENNSSRCRVRI